MDIEAEGVTDGSQERLPDLYGSAVKGQEPILRPGKPMGLFGFGKKKTGFSCCGKTFATAEEHEAHMKDDHGKKGHEGHRCC